MYHSFCNHDMLVHHEAPRSQHVTLHQRLQPARNILKPISSISTTYYVFIYDSDSYIPYSLAPDPRKVPTAIFDLPWSTKSTTIR